jgi:hypothetical protein
VGAFGEREKATAIILLEETRGVNGGRVNFPSGSDKAKVGGIKRASDFFDLRVT